MSKITSGTGDRIVILSWGLTYTKAYLCERIYRADMTESGLMWTEHAFCPQQQ